MEATRNDIQVFVIGYRGFVVTVNKTYVRRTDCNSRLGKGWLLLKTWQRLTSECRFALIIGKFGVTRDDMHGIIHYDG